MDSYSEKRGIYLTDMDSSMLMRERERIRMFKEELDIPGLYKALLEEHRENEKKLSTSWTISIVTILFVVFLLCVAYAKLVQGK